MRLNKHLSLIKVDWCEWLALSLLKRGKGFKPCFHMESSLWPALYSLQVDPVRAGINLGCGTDLKDS